MDTEDKKINASLINFEIPKSVDNVIENLTNEPTGHIGQFTADLFDLIMYPVHGAAERKRMKVDEKTERFAIERQKRLEIFKDEINKKYNKIPIENRIEPTERTLAMLDDSKFCLENDEIRKMFVNLITKSVDNQYTKKISPAFSNIIKQMSSLDAKVLSVIRNNEPLNQINVYSFDIFNDHKERKYYINILTSIDFAGVVDVGASLDNLIRCCLIEESKILIDKNQEYTKIKDNPRVKEFFGFIEKDDVINYIPRQFTMTGLGCLFYEVCCEDIN